MAWPSPLDFRAQHSDIFAKRQDGTGLWLLQLDAFKTWKDTLGAILCPGIQAVGKTVLASTVIDHLQRTFPETTIGVAWMFCSYIDRPNQTPSNLLATLLQVLLRGRVPISAILEGLYERSINLGDRPKIEEIFNVLRIETQKYDQVFFVIDALDGYDWPLEALLTRLRT